MVKTKIYTTNIIPSPIIKKTAFERISSFIYLPGSLALHTFQGLGRRADFSCRDHRATAVVDGGVDPGMDGG